MYERLSTILTILSSFSNTASCDDNINNFSAYQVLQEYDFPIGLLPKGATKYDPNRDTGDFKVYLES